MSTWRFLLAAMVGVLALATTLPAHIDQPLTVRAAISDATVDGTTVRGTMRLTVVNGGTFTVRGLTLRLVSPPTGTVGSGPIEVGDVQRDETVVATVQFRLEKAFVDSTDALTMEALYRDDGDVPTKELLQVVRDGGAR